jgi:hypothetical protein
MRYSLPFFGLLSIILIAIPLSGCVSESTVNTTSEISRNPNQDPIIGTWHWTTIGQSKTIFYTFTSDGHYSSSDSINEGTESGTWIKEGENQYNVTVNNRKLSFIYQPVTDTIAMADTPELRFYPAGKGSAIVTPKPVQPTQSKQPTSNQNSAINNPAPVYTTQKVQVISTIANVPARTQQPQQPVTLRTVTLPKTLPKYTPQPTTIPFVTFKKP